MAHELSFTGQDAAGRPLADFFTVRLPAWHNEGVVMAHHPDLDEAIQLARLDYPVEKMSCKIVVGLDGGDSYEIESSKAFVTFRKDTRKELGSVGPDYTVVQNVDAFRATIGPLVDNGLLMLETGGVLRDGADAWLLGRFDLSKFGPKAQDVFGTEVAPYALVKVNHSGRRVNEVALTPIRVVCANTLGMVEREIDGGHTDGSKSISVRHTADALGKMTEAALTLFHNVIADAEHIAEQYRLLKEFQLTTEQFNELVVVPAIGTHPTERKNWNPDARMAESVVDRYEARALAIEHLWHNGTGHSGDDSAWEAYNGVAEAIDHHPDLFPTRSGVYRTQSLLDGSLRKAKQNVLDSLVDAAIGGEGQDPFWTAVEAYAVDE